MAGGIKESRKKFNYVPKKKRGNKVPSLAEDLERADYLAQEVVNEWGVSGGDAAPLTPDFRALFEKACRYRTAKEKTENHREFIVVTEVRREQEVAEEAAAREAFVKAYRAFSDKHARASEDTQNEVRIGHHE